MQLAVYASIMLVAAPASEPTDGGSRTEIGVLPAINYNSDLGLGVGVLAAVAQLSPGSEPYDWRVQLLLYATLRDQGSGIELPYHSDYIQLDIPGFLDPKLRLNTEVAFRKLSNAAYHGFGSRSEASTSEALPARYYQYDRIYPSLSANFRIQLFDEEVSKGKRRLEMFAGTRLTYNLFDLYEGSLLETDIARLEAETDGGALGDSLYGYEDHFLWVLNLGLLWDTRDHEIIPARGTFSELSVRASPGVDADLAFVGLTLASSWFIGLYEDIVVLALRGVGDVQIGHVPFTEQTLFGALNPTSGPGGGMAVRGVPLQRFTGKIKVIANLEVRARLLPFELFEQKINLGLAAFADTGRVWADFDAPDGLDGDLGDFSVGLGGGLRAQWGETFVIRADYAVSPTEDTSGLYIDVGQVF